MIRLYSAENLQQGYLLLNLLKHQGIDCMLLNENASGGLGEIPFTQAYPEIWLSRAQDLARAREIIDDFENLEDTDRQIACPHCRERNPHGFELCWKCGRSLD